MCFLLGIAFCILLRQFLETWEPNDQTQTRVAVARRGGPVGRPRRNDAIEFSEDGGSTVASNN